MKTKDFVKFVSARHAVYLARAANKPKPWTKDEILQHYRFCNMYRELDKVTVWIALNWRAQLRMSHDLWFWMLVARLVNNTETLATLTPLRGPWQWDEDYFIDALRTRMRNGEKAWGGAYIVSTNGNKMEKASYIAQKVLTPAWHARSSIEPRRGDRLADFCDRLLTLNGVQGFIAGQVIADAKYVNPVLRKSEDWWSFAISGPGSRRGLNRVIDKDKNKPWKESEWRDTLLDLQAATNKALMNKKGFERFHAQDIQNCLCEFDKYERTRLGEGTPRSTYPGV
jgi:hypothetical protein